MKSPINCRLCGSDKLSVIIATNEFEIIVCKKCKIAFTLPSPLIPDYENMDFHSKEDKENLDKLTSINDLPYDWKNLILAQVKMIEGDFNFDADILEIGCGEGILLNELQQNGFKNIEGIEPSKTAAVRARKKKLSIINNFFSETLLQKKYDLIMMSHVFEHIEEPLGFLQKLKNGLKENGCIMLTQTNYKGLIPLIQKENWYAWVPEQHFWHFTPKGIKQLFSFFGFNCTHVKYSSLVHPHDKYYKIGKLFPKWQDQFIIMLNLN